MRTILTLVAALVALFFVQAITTPIVGGLGLPLGLAAAIAVFFLLKGNSQAGPTGTSAGFGKKFPAGFTANFAHENIAIDQAAGMLWLRDRSGHTTVVKKGDILRWTHTYKPTKGVWINNCIEIAVRDLNRPLYYVHFRRHSETWIWNAPKNTAECEEWQSRLTTWVNNS